jgi:hypothetical protein
MREGQADAVRITDADEWRQAQPRGYVSDTMALVQAACTGTLAITA